MNEYKAKRLRTDLARLKRTRKISRRQKDKVFKFLEFLNALGRAPATKSNVIWALTTIGQILGKPFEDATYDDIVRVVSEIESRYKSGKSKKALKAEIRRFYKWLRKTEEYPPEVAWIKLDYSIDYKSRVKPEDILTDEEVDRLANAALNSRDRALVYMLRDSGCRVGELISLKIKNVKFDNKGVMLYVPDGKTGRRSVRLVGEHTKELLAWLDEHPLKGDREAPVFISLSGNSKNKVITYTGVECLLKRLAVDAGLGKWIGGDGRKRRGTYVGRRVNPHNFRHKRASELLIKKKVPEPIVKKYMGWTPDSRIPQIYTHFNEEDVDNAILESEGIDFKDIQKIMPVSTRACPSCGEINTILSHFCKKCNAFLDLSSAWKEKDESVAKVLNALKEDRWFVKKVKKIIKDMGLEKRFVK